MDWTRGPIIGRGSTATVSIAASESFGILAVKSTELSQSQLLQREQQILSSLNSPHIVSYKGCSISTENNHVYYNIFMEYIPVGTLAGAIRGQGGMLSEHTIGAYTRHILLGLEYLHSNGIVHCDIKSSNIMIGPSGPKIADLGCARRVSPARVDEATAGTPLFMAPEVARGEEQGCPADIWSFGCTFIEMATGRSPWGGAWDHSNDPLSVMYGIAYLEESVPESPSCLSDEAKDFLSKCLRRDPKERWTASQLLEHCFVNKFSSHDDGRDNDHEDLINVRLKINHSPTSTLDQGMWDHDQSSCNRSSANQRIRELSLGSGLLDDWGFGVNWIVIRG